LPEHHRPRGQGLKPKPLDCSPEEKRLRQEVPEIVPYLQALKKHYSGRATLPLRRLLHMVEDYPRAPLLEAMAIAMQYGLLDLQRVENLIPAQAGPGILSHQAMSTISEEIPQLLKNLRLHKMAAIVETELAVARKSSLSYSDFLLRLLHAEWLNQQERKL
jgi:hypothetical protein